MGYAVGPGHRLVASHIALTMVVGLVAFALAAQPEIAAQTESANGTPPLLFVPNAGQTDASVRYTVTGPGHAFYFTPGKVVLDFQRGDRGVGLELRFRGANPNAAVVAERRTAGRVNYLTGSERHTNLATYSQLRYRNLWPGIDMVLHGRSGMLKYEFLVRPGANPRDIRLAYAGANSLRLSSTGALAIGTPLGTLRDAAPRSFQGTASIDSRYVLSGAEYGFGLGAYDRSRTLTIDPGLVYSTFLAEARAIDLADDGSVYLTGLARNSETPTTPGAYDTTLANGGDAFVTKLAPDGSLVYSTYIGGDSTGFWSSGTDIGYDVAVDDAGSAYVVGDTDSTFPVTGGAFRTSRPDDGSDWAFVIKLNSAGSALVYSTYIANATTGAIEVDASGNAYIGGYTTSAAYPTTPGAFDTTHSGEGDMVVTKLNATGSALLYSTFIGRGSVDGIALDTSGHAYVAGKPIRGTDFPATPGAYDTVNDTLTADANVTKLSPTGASLVYSTFLGRNGHDEGNDIAVDAAGNAYVTGFTESTEFPTTSGAYAPGRVGDGFVTKLNSAASGLVYSTYIPSSGGGRAIDIDADGKAYVTGMVSAQTFTATGLAHDGTFDGQSDAYVMELSTSGSTLDYASYLGGSQSDQGTGIAVDDQGNSYVVGSTGSADFPITPGAVDSTLSDGFVTKLATLEVTGYPRPKSASPFRASLVVAYRECTDPNEIHGPPLAYGSCGSPQMTSDHLTVGTPDANALPALNSGFMRFAVALGDPATPADEADVNLALFTDDVFTKALSDYAGELRASFTVRITDRDNVPVGGGAAGIGTTVDVPLGATFPCAPTADPNEGSTCSASTSIEAIIPGAVTERLRSLWQLDKVRVFDGGPDGDGDTVGGNTVFATQGLFIP